MNELPVASGISICELVITDSRTGHPSLINRISKLVMPVFPTPPQRLAVYSALNDGFGHIPIRILIEPMDGGEAICDESVVVDFIDRLEEVLFVAEIPALVFPQPGVYQASLTAEHEPLARCLFRILPRDGANP